MTCTLPLLEPCRILCMISMIDPALHALANSSPMPSTLLLLEPCTFIPMINPAHRCTHWYVASSRSLSQVLSHDFTMATNSEHAHYIIKWRIRHTQSLMLLCNCRDNAKLACHCTVCYRIEWIYIKSKVRGPVLS